MLNATVLHFACFSAKDDAECVKMIEVLTSGSKYFNNQIVLQKNHDGLTAVCTAARRSFEQSVEYLLDLYKCSKQDNSCNIELEYGVRSNNVLILDKIYQKHEKCSYQVNRNESHS